MMKIKFYILLCVFFAAVLPSCSPDHNHGHYGYEYYEQPYNYYYYDGKYYYDNSYKRPISLDVNHYYYGRIEWKGRDYGWAVVLKENPFYGLICDIDDQSLYNVMDPYRGDGEVMIRFSWYGGNNGAGWPVVFVNHWYYK